MAAAGGMRMWSCCAGREGSTQHRLHLQLYARTRTAAGTHDAHVNTKGQKRASERPNTHPRRLGAHISHTLTILPVFSYSCNGPGITRGRPFGRIQYS